MLQWKINLLGYGAADRCDVATQDGEIIGTWDADENDHCSFTPDGADKPLFFHPFLPMLCDKIAKWHESQAEKS